MHLHPSVSQVRVVLLAAAPLDSLFVHSGGEDERDRQLLDDLGLSGVNSLLLQQHIQSLKNSWKAITSY